MEPPGDHWSRPAAVENGYLAYDPPERALDNDVFKITPQTNVTYIRWGALMERNGETGLINGSATAFASGFNVLRFLTDDGNDVNVRRLRGCVSVNPDGNNQLRDATLY